MILHDAGVIAAQFFHTIVGDRYDIGLYPTSARVCEEESLQADFCLNPFGAMLVEPQVDLLHAKLLVWAQIAQDHKHDPGLERYCARVVVHYDFLVNFRKSTLFTL